VNLEAAQRAFLAGARRATLATLAPDGRPRLVPICFVLEPDAAVVWTPLDEKPKSVDDVRRLARVRDIVDRPEVVVLVDRWSEDWTELGWLRLHGLASLVTPPPVEAQVIAELRAKYAQYRSHDLEGRPLIRIEVTHVVGWGAIGD
jgi:PPOX class probable F420-dependent enzyme